MKMVDNFRNFLLLAFLASSIQCFTLDRLTRCKNEFGDTGTCVHQRDCLESRGIAIGLCSPRGNLACCLNLPCSNLSNLLASKNRRRHNNRSKRAILHPSIPILHAKIDPVCGLRIDESENDTSTNERSMRNPVLLQRQEQLINGITLDFNDNRFPWMLGLWLVVHDNFKAPTCGAALISNQFAITAAHCVNDARV